MHEFGRTALNKVQQAFGGRLWLAALTIGVVSNAAAPDIARAKAAEPPQCTAIVVPGLPRTASDGRHEAWVYKARFGRLALDGVMRSGSPIDYRFTLNGRALDPLLGPASKTVNICLKAKGVARPSRYTPHACPGDRFKVILARPANDRFLLLYVSAGNNTWRFCRASSVSLTSEPEHPKARS